MSRTQQFILAVMVAAGGLALIVVGALQGKSDLWIAGIGVMTTVGAWIGLPRPIDLPQTGVQQ